MTDRACELCAGTGWVCENHTTKPWGKNLGSGECDCGAGNNCVCNPNGEVEWAVVYATTEPNKVKGWMQ